MEQARQLLQRQATEQADVERALSLITEGVRSSDYLSFLIGIKRLANTKRGRRMMEFAIRDMAARIVRSEGKGKETNEDKQGPSQETDGTR
ncbi:MAG: hypothetical protein HQL86_08815 [Magnetococcales bacterium]|nr:hypothetical protein [Magnetococcales bacterium]